MLKRGIMTAVDALPGIEPRKASANRTPRCRSKKLTHTTKQKVVPQEQNKLKNVASAYIEDQYGTFDNALVDGSESTTNASWPGSGGSRIDSACQWEMPRWKGSNAVITITNPTTGHRRTIPWFAWIRVHSKPDRVQDANGMLADYVTMMEKWSTHILGGSPQTSKVPVLYIWDYDVATMPLPPSRASIGSNGHAASVGCGADTVKIGECHGIGGRGDGGCTPVMPPCVVVQKRAASQVQRRYATINDEGAVHKTEIDYGVTNSKRFRCAAPTNLNASARIRQLEVLVSEQSKLLEAALAEKAQLTSQLLRCPGCCQACKVVDGELGSSSPLTQRDSHPA
jgi:hypothetical protein